MRAGGRLEGQQSTCSEAHPHGDDCRCLCGNLLARVIDDRVELKCRRCKRTVSIPLATGSRPVRVKPSLTALRKAGAS